MNKTISWLDRVDSYLVYRRRNGFDLRVDETHLKSFARFADAASGTHDHLTVALCVAWAQTAKHPNKFTWARRIEVLRGFAYFCLREDSATEIVPINLFGHTHRRLVPHIFTDAEVIALLDATNALKPQQGMHPSTCRCVFGLLAASGLRISEAIGLTRQDADLISGVLLIREAKFHKQRLVALHSSVTESLSAYAKLRDQLVPSPVCDRFFLQNDGHCINQRSMLYALQSLCRRMDWQPRGDYLHHRLHDLRHTFIVHSALRFYEQGIDVDRAVLALSIYVGHAKVSDTYWYFTGIPELMAIAAQRFQQFAQEGVR